MKYDPTNELMSFIFHQKKRSKTARWKMIELFRTKQFDDQDQFKRMKN
jgi:hypothetical protein